MYTPWRGKARLSDSVARNRFRNRNLRRAGHGLRSLCRAALVAGFHPRYPVPSGGRLDRTWLRRPQARGREPTSCRRVAVHRLAFANARGGQGELHWGRKSAFSVRQSSPQAPATRTLLRVAAQTDAERDHRMARMGPSLFRTRLLGAVAGGRRTRGRRAASNRPCPPRRHLGYMSTHPKPFGPIHARLADAGFPRLAIPDYLHSARG